MRRAFPRSRRAGVVLGMVLLSGWGTEAGAHPLAPSLLELRALGDGRFDVTWKTPLQRPSGSELVPRLPENCRVDGGVDVAVEGSGLLRRWTIDCGAEGVIGSTLGVDGLVGTSVLVRLELADGRLLQHLLDADAPSVTVPAAASRGTVAVDYLSLGIEHILSGADHLLFVLGLLLLVGFHRRLAWTVTAFTLGHSVTLSLASLGFVHTSSAPIEMAIAGSILVLAVELARDPAAAPSLLRRRPGSMTAAFGLLHGLGFASALAEVGLPEREIPWALASFNAGIELGQLAFIVAAFVVFLGLRSWRRPWAAWISRAPVYVLGSLSAFWLFERLENWWRVSGL